MTVYEMKCLPFCKEFSFLVQWVKKNLHSQIESNVKQLRKSNTKLDISREFVVRFGVYGTRIINVDMRNAKRVMSDSSMYQYLQAPDIIIYFFVMEKIYTPYPVIHKVYIATNLDRTCTLKNSYKNLFCYPLRYAIGPLTSSSNKAAHCIRN